MKVGIVGANGQVGTGLSFLLADAGADVVPIVRSALAAATFDRYGFEYRIADVTDADEASVCSDLDVTVMAAFASYRSRDELRVKQARRDNERLVRNAVRSTAPDATVLYLSTVAAFGDEIGTNEWWWYGREKRRLERVFAAELEATETTGYAFRLGHVFGPNQGIARDVHEELGRNHSVRVRADADAPSNAVHVPTIGAAIRQCVQTPVETGTYTVVNEPQWTWGDVIDYYAPDDGSVSVGFAPTSDGASRWGSHLSRYAFAVLRRLPYGTAELLPYVRYLPDRVGRQFYRNLQRRNRVRELQRFRRRNDYWRREFDYEPAPGPSIPGVELPRPEIAEAERAIESVL